MVEFKSQIEDLENPPLVEFATVGDIYSRRLLASSVCVAVVGIAIALQRDGHCVAQWDLAPSM